MINKKIKTRMLSYHVDNWDCFWKNLYNCSSKNCLLCLKLLIFLRFKKINKTKCRFSSIQQYLYFSLSLSLTFTSILTISLSFSYPLSQTNKQLLQQLLVILAVRKYKAEDNDSIAIAARGSHVTAGPFWPTSYMASIHKPEAVLSG